MKPLEKALRSQLERTVREARDVAEAAAVSALQQLGVGESAPFVHQSKPERELRRRLRIHGRQLGDTLNGGKTQTMDRLVEEVAYEHWHRMLFARFLAENNLLMYPDPANPVPVTLEECEDLAAKEGAKTGWELAARFAACMLPQIFRVDSPVFQLILPPEHQQKLERLVEELPEEAFTASDSLGWVYQFWQAKKKDEVNASEVKIGARELPAVTQLFTEPYMVSFLLDNSLGAWWAARRLTKSDFATARSEEELRKKVSLPGVPLEYLRFIKGENGSWITAGGTFDGWPEHLSELKVLDPCCGSGHFLVAAFLMLVPMRIELEGLSPKEATDAVLRENIHGLELDKRCVELAAFAMALTAWRYPNAGSYRLLPELNIACSGSGISAKKEEWLALAGNNDSLRMSLELLYEQFKDAQLLGSLINPELSLGKGSLFELKWDDVGPLLTKALAGERDDETTEIGVIAQGIAKAASILSSRYDLITTNVPYLGMKRMDSKLYEFCDTVFNKGKADLATVFLERWVRSSVNANICFVLPQNWLFLGSYREFRKEILRNQSLNIVVLLGSGAFDTISGEVVKATLLNLRVVKPRENQISYGLDVSHKSSIEDKATELRKAQINCITQDEVRKKPDSRIIISQGSFDPLLDAKAMSKRGIVNGDNEKWLRHHYELPFIQFKGWKLLQSSVNKTSLYSGRELIIDWRSNGQGMLRPGLDNPTYGKRGVAVNRMGNFPATIYTGELYDQNTAVLVPFDERDLPSLMCYVKSQAFCDEVRKLDKKLGITPATFLKIPYNHNYWTKVAQELYPNGLLKPYSSDPTQWIFHGHPAGSDHPLQVAVARLLDYRWPAELDDTMELSNETYYWINKSKALLSYVDEDGIVCIPSVRGEMKAEDQLERLLAAAYGGEWSSNKKSELLAEVGYAGKTLDSWLREKFFTQHFKLFHDRPFIWHVWDGLSDGFAALVNYHKLDAKKLETLIYTYLGDWISRQKQDSANGVDGAEEKLAAAEALKKRLELILEGEAPYDVFVRWKPLEKQPIGWNPDLNDGARLNIRPFMSVPDVGKKGAGVLRDKLNIKWDKDRGKDVESAPWYHLFKGERINDHHLSLSEKRNARKNLSS